MRLKDLSLKEKMENPARPVILYEMIPPQAGNAEDWETNLASVRELAGKVDGINSEQIISRNFKPSLRMLARLTGFYRQPLQARYASSGGSLQTASLPRPLAEQSTGHWN